MLASQACFAQSVTKDLVLGVIHLMAFIFTGSNCILLRSTIFIGSVKLRNVGCDQCLNGWPSGTTRFILTLDFSIVGNLKLSHRCRVKSGRVAK
jgi:hypothetical protein